MEKTYDFYSDAGHGWMKVPIAQLVSLGIAGDISHFSYMKGGFAYLEEDSDAQKFIEAMEKRGDTVKWREHNSDTSPIRDYPSYRAPVTAKMFEGLGA